MRKQLTVLILFAFVLFAAAQVSAASKGAASEKIQFKDVRSQTVEFIGYYKSIKLTKEQEQIKQTTLSSIPAPCCSNFSMATCCCPCNLAKSVWGLSNYLIAKKNYDAQKLRVAVLEWFMFTNKGVYAGDACSQGRCGQPFKYDGCGGMKEEQVVF
jgi:hypothetical protein